MTLAFWFSAAFISAFDAETDFLANSIKCGLTTNTYTPNQDTHDYWDDVTNEVTGTGYTAGGVALTTKVNSNALNVVKWDSDDPQWTTSTITARRAVYYDDTPGTAATKPLYSWVDFEADKASSAGNFTIQQAAGGILTATPADATGFPA